MLIKKIHKKNIARVLSFLVILFLLSFQFTQSVFAASLSLKEYYSYLSTVKDTDHDGLTDEQENTLGTSPVMFDTDADGYSDGEEYNEFGTDPLKYDKDLFAESDQNIRLVDLSPKLSVEGTHLFVKGVYKEKNTKILLNFENQEGLGFRIPFNTDERGVFHQVVALDEFCKLGAQNIFTIQFHTKLLSTVTLHCGSTDFSALLSNTEFNEQPFTPGDATQLLVIDHLEYGFKAQLHRELDTKGYFSSIVTSAGMLSDSSIKTIVAFPSLPLEEGKHEFILTLREPVTNTYYDPVIVPFEIVSDKWGYLKSYLYGGGSASIMAALIGVAGIIRIRRMKRLKKVRVYDKDY